MIAENIYGLLFPEEVEIKNAPTIYIDTDHDLDMGLAKRIKDGNFSTLTGEQTHIGLYSILYGKENSNIAGRSLLDAIKNPSTGSNAQSKTESVIVTKELMGQGLNFWLTDSTAFDLKKNNEDFPELFYHMLYFSLIGSITLAPLLKYAIDSNDKKLKKKDKVKFTRRQFLNMSALTTGFLGASILGLDQFMGREINSKFVDSMQSIINNPDFITAEKGMLEVRNHVMVLNTLHMLSLYRDSISKEKVLFFAANGHSDVVNLFKKNVDDIEEYIRNCVKIMFQVTIDILIDKGLEDKKIIEIMLGYSRLFSEPDQVSKNIKMFKLNRENKGITPSAASLFLSEAINFCRNKNNGERQIKLIENLMLSFVRDVSFFKKAVFKQIVSNFPDSKIMDTDYLPTNVVLEDFSEAYIFKNGSDLGSMGVGVYMERVFEFLLPNDNVGIAEIEILPEHKAIII